MIICTPQTSHLLYATSRHIQDASNRPLIEVSTRNFPPSPCDLRTCDRCPAVHPNKHDRSQPALAETASTNSGACHSVWFLETISHLRPAAGVDLDPQKRVSGGRLRLYISHQRSWYGASNNAEYCSDMPLATRIPTDLNFIAPLGYSLGQGKSEQTRRYFASHDRDRGSGD
jgi:hypothetical protein